jgi:hypothetical protein
MYGLWHKLWVLDQINRFIGSLAIITTLSYHYDKVAITITHNQLTLSRYKTALSKVLRLVDESHTLSHY